MFATGFAWPMLSLGLVLGAMSPARADAIGSGTSGAAFFSLSLMPNMGGNPPDALLLGSPPSGTLAGFYTAANVDQINADGTVTQLGFSGGSLLDPAGLYTGINSHSGGPTAPFYSLSGAVPGFYAATGVGGSWELQTFTNGVLQNENSFSLLWGSVDDLNSLIFSSNGMTVATVTGSQLQKIASAASSKGIAGTQSFYVTINTPGLVFDTVTGQTGNNYFEATNFAELPIALPEPAGLPLFVVGLAGLFAVRGRTIGRDPGSS